MEFLSKLGVAREEADEGVDWLEYLRDANIAHSPRLITVSKDLVAILTASLKTASRNAKGPQHVAKR